MTPDEFGAVSRAMPESRRLARRELVEAMQGWRRVFAADLHDATGKWRFQDADWQLFDSGYCPHLAGGRAQAAYGEITPLLMYVIFEREGRIVEGRLGVARSLPVLVACALDVYIFPPSYDWTMVYPWEMTLDHGPFFTRREWLEAWADAHDEA